MRRKAGNIEELEDTEVFLRNFFHVHALIHDSEFLLGMISRGGPQERQGTP